MLETEAPFLFDDYVHMNTPHQAIQHPALPKIAEMAVVSIPTSQAKSGTAYIDAKLHTTIEVDDILKIQDDLEQEIATCPSTFEVGDDLLKDEKTALLLLGRLYNHCHILQTLKVVEYVGPNTGSNVHLFTDVQVKVLVYKLYDSRQENEAIEQAEITSLPHVDFDGRWDNLLFKEDLKSDLIRMISNMLRFSSRATNRRADMNPLILLYGPPGTGKSSLAQGLAQKISIRLNSTYKRTKLIQIRTATLLSKFYSESAKQVDKIFATIEEMCEEDSEQFICVLIDEVESIANSRESSMHGEAQDSLRATNALLTGFDRARRYSNIIFLCTSNMLACLDAAFLDRCGLKIHIGLPSSSVKYEILRGRLLCLMTDGMITPPVAIPCYRDARLQHTSDNKDAHESKLFQIVEYINDTLDSTSASGRYLTQLPEQSILRNLENGDCNLDTALLYMHQSVLENGAIGREGSEGGSKGATFDHPGAITFHAEKRKTCEETDIEDALDVLDRFVAMLRRKRVKEQKE